MKETIAFAAIVLFLSSSGCTGSPPQGIPCDRPIEAVKVEREGEKSQANRLVGYWFADERTTDGGRRLTLTERRVDGSFKSQFRLVKPGGEVEEITEVGEWGTSGPVYFTITKGWLHGEEVVAAGPDPYFRDAYEILTLAPDAFDYRHYIDGDVYRSRRVTQDFRLPDIEGK